MKSFWTSTMMIALFGRTILERRGLLAESDIPHLLDPHVPTEDELLDAHAAVPRGVEDQEDLGDETAVHLRGILSSKGQRRRHHSITTNRIGLPMLVTEQIFAHLCELVDVDRQIPTSGQVFSLDMKLSITYSSLS